MDHYLLSRRGLQVWKPMVRGTEALEVEAAHCADGDKIADGPSVSDSLTDFLVLMLPSPTVGHDLVEVIQHFIPVARLKMSNTWKLKVVVVLMPGAMEVLFPRAEVIYTETSQVLLVQPSSGWFLTAKLPRQVWPKRQTSLVGLHLILIHTLHLTSDMLLPRGSHNAPVSGHPRSWPFPNR